MKTQCAQSDQLTNFNSRAVEQFVELRNTLQIQGWLAQKKLIENRIQVIGCKGRNDVTKLIKNHE